ncbi:NAD(P)H-hydrate dehydratase [candidate division KSB1 bacterium]
MKWVVTADEMRNIDKRTIENIGIPGSTLMERAGLEVVDAVLDIFGSVQDKTVIVFCGKGNNGGDGLVIAREMKRQGADVKVVIFGKSDTFPDDTKNNYDILRRMKAKIDFIASESRLKAIPDKADIIVDALLGTGIRGEVTGILREAVRKINSMDGFIVSVDIPSGLNTDTGTFVGDCVGADLTVTMGLLKRGLLLHPGNLLAGDIVLADIGFPERGISPEKVRTFYIEQDDVFAFLPQRLPYYHKGDCGKILIIGGSPGMTGAAALTASGALRAGAGMTLLGIPRGLNTILEQKLTETMTLPLPETEDGTLSLGAESAILDALVWADVLAIGPGMGRNEETAELTQSIVKQAEVPVVIDADGLFALAKNTGILRNRKYNTIITPHVGEFCRMIHKDDVNAVELDRLEVLRKYSRRWQSVILLKGAPTLIAGKNSEIFFNATGNAGMATAGSGDVLTGIVAAMIGQELDLTAAGFTGAYMHGLAGDLAADELGEHSVVAQDLVDFLPYAFESVLEYFDDSEDECSDCECGN